MAYNPNPALVRAIRSQGGDLAPLLLATTLVESGGRLDAVGDGGRSHGPFQMYDQGRGYGVPIAKRRDPVFSTNSALAEFRRFQSRGYSGPELAYAAQRPADRSGYIRKISAALPEARRILGMPDTGAPAPRGRKVPTTPAGAPAPTSPAPPGADAGGSLAMAAITAINEIGTEEGVQPSTLLNLSAARSAFDNPPQAAQQAQTAIRQQRAKGAKGKGPQGPAAAPGAVPDAPAAPGGKLTPILPGQPQWGSYGYGDPEGQGGRHLAVDWFAKHGTPARAPIAGKVVRITPHSGPGGGQVFGGVLSIRGVDGRLYVMRHIDPLNFKVGESVSPGQHVGTPTAWTGGAHHIHFETYRPGSSDREYGAEYAINPRSLF